MCLRRSRGTPSGWQLKLCRLKGFADALWFHPTGSDDFEHDRNH